MATKLEYLKMVCSQKVSMLEVKEWYFYLLSIVTLKDQEVKNKDYLSLFTKADGIYFLNKGEDDTLVEEKITDYLREAPLFSISDKILIDSSWMSNVKGTIETTLGRIIVNKLVLYDVLGDRLPFINSKITVSDIEKIFSIKVKNDEDLTDKDISVREMNECVDRLTFLNVLGPIISVAATHRTITASPKLAGEKARLVKEYEGRLGDPSTAVEFESKLDAIDKEYLAEDKHSGKVFSKKSVAGRKKMLLTIGNTNDFTATGKGMFIVRSLNQGMSTDPVEFSALVNDIRFSSFSRGGSTARGGYAYKIIQRGMGAMIIDQTPCNTTKGFVRLIDSSNKSKLTGRYIKEAGKWVLIKDAEEAGKYVGKEVETRSVAYCKTKGNRVCYACMSAEYKGRPSGISNLVSGVSTVLLKIGLKAMHASVTETSNIEMSDLCS